MRPECHGGSNTSLQPSQLGEHNRRESCRAMTVVRNGLDVFLQARRGVSHSLCAGSGLFYLRGEAFFQFVDEVLKFPGYRTTGFFYLCLCETTSHTYSKNYSSAKVNSYCHSSTL